VKSILFVSCGGAVALAVVLARADSVVPPWIDPGDVPLPEWARSVAPLRADTAIAAVPGHPEEHRGTTSPLARLPLYGAKRAAGCAGRWLDVGPLAWICSDAAEMSRDPPAGAPRRRGDDALPYRYVYVGPDGAEAYLNLPSEGDDLSHGIEAPEETLDPDFSLAIAEEREARGGKWGRTSHGKWVPMRELIPFRPSPFAGVQTTNGALDFAWVASDVAPEYPAPAPRGKPSAKRPRFDKVAWREERAAPNGAGAMVRVSEDGASPERWMRARDLVRPTLAQPPDEAGGASATARWIDVDLAAQTLVAYEGTKPVFATLVSTGKGANATPAGVHRIWVKIAANDMENLADEGDENDGDRFSIEDVPYVQYFEHGVALHGAFWHRDFGRTHSHGCVNLAPKDAAWLFGFTAPHVPAGWDAAYPTELEPGTVVRVRAGAGAPEAFPLDPTRGKAIHGKAASAAAEAP
jgi:lipoprotein-anchoring transpeptidase ErfK/SrfK